MQIHVIEAAKWSRNLLSEFRDPSLYLGNGWS